MSNSIHWMNHKPMYKVLDKLEGVKPAGQNKWQAKCPAHDDRSPSLSIAIGDDGRILLYCHAGCNNEEICTALSIEQKDLFVQKSKPYRVHSQIVATYDYVDENGNLLFQVVREKPKKFWQRRPDGNGSWIRNLQGVRRVLYRLPELLQADPNQPVFLVEGEKDADRLITEGLIATTTPMGAGKWREEYTEILRDRKVVVLPDNDAAGEKHAVRIANALIDVAAEVKIISLPDLPDKGDISDWLDAGGTAKQLLDNAARVEAYQPPTEAKSLDYSIANAEIPYRATENGLFRLKPTQDGDMPVQLTNFTARIVEDIIADDGVETSHEFMIVAKLTGTETRFKVPAAQFAGLNWVTEHLGPCAIVFPPFFTKDYARAAIQLLSKDINVRYIYRHIGWRKIGDHHFYLHAGGAIGAEGPVEKVEVSLEDALQHYILPAPPAGGDLVTAIQTSIAILDLAPDNIIIPLYSALWRSVLGHCPFAVHLSGHTGTGKSEIAALLQQHFGAGMMAKNLPASWSSTANALEGLSFTAKDTLIVVDDFAPGGSSSEVNRFHREADRILRAQGNRSGRQRMRSNATLRPTKPPRGLILSTGEDVPRGQSIRARMLILELGLNYLDWGLLTQCQGHAADGLFAQSMSAFIQWLAPQYESIKNRMPQEIAEFRLSATQSNQHKRTPEIIAELALGMNLFLKFAQETGAIDGEEFGSIWHRCWEALGQAAAAQVTYQSANDPVHRFIELLSSAIASGRTHIAGDDGAAPSNPSAWGWRQKTMGYNSFTTAEWQPLGDRIGWVEGDDLYLIPDASYQAAQQMAGNGGEGITLALRTLQKRLKERGKLLTTEDGRLTCRKVLEGSRRRVLHLAKGSLVCKEVDQLGHLGHEPQPSDGNEDCGPVLGTTSGMITDESGPGTGPQTPILYS